MKTAGEVKPRSRPHAKRIASTGGRFRISDELWALMEPLLPKHQNTHRFGGGRPRVPDRQCADAIFFVLRTGCQWNALLSHGPLPQFDGPRPLWRPGSKTATFERFWQAGLAEYDACNGIDWSWLSMDGAMSKAPLAGEKNRPQRRGPQQAGHQTLAFGGGQRRTGGFSRRRRQPKRLQALG
jgi:putative transposase